MREAANGDLIFPHRGNPPPCPDGYIRDKGDPFICKPDAPCKHQTMKEVVAKCCDGTMRLYCLHFKEHVELKRCKDCNYREL